MERSKRILVLMVVATAEFLTTFMVSSVIVALHTIDDEWHVSAVALSWIPLAYVLMAAALLMPCGKLADLFGRMRFFSMGMMVFTVFAFASAFAPSTPVLIVLRLLTGAGTAMVYACTAALVTLSHPPETRGRALSVQVTGVYFGLTVGPLLGGVIIDHLGWRWVFIFVGILGVVNCVICRLGLHDVEWREPKRARFDVTGSVIWAAALSMLLIGLSLIPDALGWVLAVAGVCGVAGFLWWETRPKDPILSLDLFRQNRMFAWSNAATFTGYVGTTAITFLVSLYLEYNMGLKAQTVGLVLVTGMAVQTLVVPFAGRLADRLQARLLAASGQTVSVLALAMLAFLGSIKGYWYVILALCVQGVGFGLFSTPNMHVIMGSVDRRYAGVAGATVSSMRMTGQNISMGVATLLLAVFVGRHPIEAADYPNVLTSVRATFAVFAALCVLGAGASLVGPRKLEAGETPAKVESDQGAQD